MRYWLKALSLALGILSAVPTMAQQKETQRRGDKNKYSYMQALDVLGTSMALLERHFVDSVDLKRLSRIGLEPTVGLARSSPSVPIAPSSLTILWRACPLLWQVYEPET